MSLPHLRSLGVPWPRFGSLQRTRHRGPGGGRYFPFFVLMFYGSWRRRHGGHTRSPHAAVAASLCDSLFLCCVFSHRLPRGPRRVRARGTVGFVRCCLVDCGVSPPFSSTRRSRRCGVEGGIGGPAEVGCWWGHPFRVRTVFSFMAVLGFETAPLPGACPRGATRTERWFAKMGTGQLGAGQQQERPWATAQAKDSPVGAESGALMRHRVRANEYVQKETAEQGSRIQHRKKGKHTEKHGGR